MNKINLPMHECFHKGQVPFLLLVCISFPVAAETKSVRLTNATSIEFVNAKKGSELLRQHDDFIENISALDRQLRLQSADEVTLDDFVSFISKQTLDWNQPDLDKVNPLIAAISKQLAAFNIRFPETIEIVKTNGMEEGGAAHCRGRSTIVLPSKVLNRPSSQLQSTLTHELFHILSRHDKTLRDKMYEAIGFRRVKFDYPTTLSAKKITNPDAAILSHFIELRIDDKKTVPAIPITYSEKEKYEGGSLFDYVTFRLLVVRMENGIAKAENEDDPALLDPAKQVDYFRQIGRNTGYIIHPEEILADNFVFMVSQKKELANPEIVAAMRDLFQRTEPTTSD